MTTAETWRRLDAAFKVDVAERMKTRLPPDPVICFLGSSVVYAVYLRTDQFHSTIRDYDPFQPKGIRESRERRER